MSIHNPYKKRLRFDDVVINYTDEISLTKLRKDGKWEVIEDIVLNMENCWNRLPSRNILLRLFKGTASYQDLIEHFKYGVTVVERREAEKEERNENPFPFGEERQRFLKEINELKIIGFVMQSGTDIMGENGVMYTLTDEGLNFVKKKLVGMIEQDNFDVFMVLLSYKDRKRVYYSHVLMKLAELRELPHDQIIYLIDDLEDDKKERGPTGQELLVEYVKYLKEIEEEDVKNFQLPVIYTELLSKVKKLEENGMVIFRDGMYFLTTLGDKTTENFLNSVADTIDFLRNAGLLVLESVNDRYVFTLLPEGVILAREIKTVYESDEQRLVQSSADLDDFDLHETVAVLPIEIKIEEETGKEKEKRLSMYIIPKYKLTRMERTRENLNAVVGAIAIFLVIFMFVGFFLLSYSQTIGYSIIVSSILLLLVFGFAYPASTEWLRARRNKSEADVIKEQFEKKTHVSDNILKKMIKMLKKGKRKGKKRKKIS